MDPPGYALKVGQLFANIISSVNDVAGLHAAPLTLVDVLKCMDDGKAILASMQTASDVRTLAQAAVDSAAVVGPACRSGMTGLLASPNRQGTLSTATVSKLTSVSPQYVRTCKKLASAGEFGTYGMTRRDSRNNVRIRKSPIEESERVCMIYFNMYVVLHLQNEFVRDSPPHVTWSRR